MGVRFIRVRGRIIPITDRQKKSVESVASTAAGAAVIAGGAKTASNYSHKASRAISMANQQNRIVKKATRLFDSNVKKGITSPEFKGLFKKLAAEKLNRAAKLRSIARKSRLKFLVAKRSAFAVGGALLGHGISEGASAVLDRKLTQTEKGVSFGLGISASSIAAAFMSHSRYIKPIKILRNLK